MNPKTKKQLLKTFGANLREARLDARSTQAALARRAGISIAYLRLLERGGRNPPTTTLVHLARQLGIPPSQLLSLPQAS